MNACPAVFDAEASQSHQLHSYHPRVGQLIERGGVGGRPVEEVFSRSMGIAIAIEDIAGPELADLVRLRAGEAGDAKRGG